MKKIYDIMPADIKQKEEGEFLSIKKAKNMPKEKKQKARAERPKKKERQEKQKSAKRWFLIAPAVFLFLLFVMFFVLSLQAKLDISLKMKTRDISLTEIVKAKEGASLSLENKVVSAINQQEKATASQTFTATGKEKVGKKASGKITIYNKQDPPKELSLRATTRFLSANGSKIFRIEKTIIVPKAKLVNGKLQPGFVEVEIIAEEPGEDYNIEPSQFSLPGLSGTNWFYNVWAESKSQMTGGSKTEKTIVSKTDLETAQNTLEQVLRKMALDSLRDNLSYGLVLLEDGFLDEEFSYFCSAKEKDAVDSFKCDGNLTIKGLVFQEQDINDLGLYLLSFEIASNEELQENGFGFSAEPKAVILKDKQMDLEVVFFDKTFIPLNEEDLKGDILGKNKERILEVLSNNYNQAEVLSIKFWPFWINKAPKNIERINITQAP